MVYPQEKGHKAGEVISPLYLAEFKNCKKESAFVLKVYGPAMSLPLPSTIT